MFRLERRCGSCHNKCSKVDCGMRTHQCLRGQRFKRAASKTPRETTYTIKPKSRNWRPVETKTQRDSANQNQPCGTMLCQCGQSSAIGEIRRAAHNCDIGSSVCREFLEGSAAVQRFRVCKVSMGFSANRRTPSSCLRPSVGQATCAQVPMKFDTLSATEPARLSRHNILYMSDASMSDSS